MLRTIAFAAVLAALGTSGPAAAGSWGVGVGFGYGPPVYWGPQAVFHDRPVIVRRAPRGYYYEEAPVFVAPPAPVYRAVGPEEVFDMLDRSGYRELSPMARRGAVYRLHAVDPAGDLVALEISAWTGAIERVRLLQARYAAPPPPVQPPAVAAPPRPLPAPAVAAPPRPKPVREAAPAANPAAPPAASATAGPPAGAVGGGSAPAPLSDRLQPVPAEPTGEEKDPLVVY